MQENQREIARLEALTPKGADKLSKDLEQANKEAARASKEVADNYKAAADAAKSASQSFADVVAGSRFASESAQKTARATLEQQAVEALRSSSVNREAVSREFGLNVAQAGSLDIAGGGQQFRRSFTGAVGPLDLQGLGLDQLQALVNETKPLADGAKSIQDSNKALQTAIEKLNSSTESVANRESNLTVTVPIGGRESIYLP